MHNHWKRHVVDHNPGHNTRHPKLQRRLLASIVMATDTVSATTSVLTPAQLEQFRTQGYVVVNTMVSPDMLDALRAAADIATDRARRGDWPHGIRTRASPFPPYVQDATKDVWGVHMLIHPDMGQAAFADWYGSEAVRGAVAALLGVGIDDLQMELVNMLVNPVEADSSLPWHRDMVPNPATEEEEAEALKETAGEQSGVQWNTALYDDSCFVFVPGSHTRVRTAEERSVTLTDSYGDLSGQERLTLKTGETIFYNPNLLHRATYDCTVKRASLHCSMGAPSKGGEVRAANIFHVMGRDKAGWITDPKFIESLPPGGGLSKLHSNLLGSLAKAKTLGLIPETDDDDKRVQAYKTQVEHEKK